jgi:hypothetical protein
METTTVLQNYRNEEETDRDNTNALIATVYTGKNRKIEGLRGECYFSGNDDQWYFRPSGTETDNWYRVKLENLKGMVE